MRLKLKGLLSTYIRPLNIEPADAERGDHLYVHSAPCTEPVQERLSCFVMRHLGAGAESFPTRLLSEIRLRMYVCTYIFGGRGKIQMTKQKQIAEKRGKSWSSAGDASVAPLP